MTGQGGYYRNNGTITMDHTVGNDTVFLLEVEKGKNVMLKFSDSSVSPPATLYVYDGFDQSNLLTTLHGQINFPILSRSSKMMIIAVEFSLSHFTAKFEGITPGEYIQTYFLYIIICTSVFFFESYANLFCFIFSISCENAFSHCNEDINFQYASHYYLT